jgi:hypothetical protein
MTLYKDLFTNVKFANSIEEKRAFIAHFMRELTKQGPHCELVFGKGECLLITSILRKFNIPHDISDLSSLRGEFTCIIVEIL